MTFKDSEIEEHLARFPGRVMLPPFVGVPGRHVLWPVMILAACFAGWLGLYGGWGVAVVWTGLFGCRLVSWHLRPPGLTLDGDGFEVRDYGNFLRVRWRDVETVAVRWPGWRLSGVHVTAHGVTASVHSVAGLPPRALVRLLTVWRERALTTYGQGNVFTR